MPLPQGGLGTGGGPRRGQGASSVHLRDPTCKRRGLPLASRGPRRAAQGRERARGMCSAKQTRPEAALGSGGPGTWPRGRAPATLLARAGYRKGHRISPGLPAGPALLGRLTPPGGHSWLARSRRSPAWALSTCTGELGVGAVGRRWGRGGGWTECWGSSSLPGAGKKKVTISTEGTSLSVFTG